MSTKELLLIERQPPWALPDQGQPGNHCELVVFGCDNNRIPYTESRLPFACEEQVQVTRTNCGGDGPRKCFVTVIPVGNSDTLKNTCQGETNSSSLASASTGTAEFNIGAEYVLDNASGALFPISVVIGVLGYFAVKKSGIIERIFGR